MIELGTILIKDETSIVEARNRIRILAEDLKFDSIGATRLATITSELSRIVYQKGEESRIVVGFDKKEEVFGLVLIFESKKEELSIGNAEIFFDSLQPSRVEDGFQRVDAFKYIPDPEFKPSEEFINTEKERLIRLSMAELLNEVKRKNEELLRLLEERKRAKEKIEASLREKEALLREIHHRVKNNLQIISSLLSMQARKAKDKNVVESLLDSRSRIQTMSLIHAQLYQSENLERIVMDITIRKLVSFMSQLYAKAEKNITSVVTAESVILSISQAIPCGLIINELVSNALKHAFKGMTEGSIEISMREAGDKIKLTVKDNGVGIPEELDIYKTDTLGLKLVRTLAEEQLKGKMGLIRDNGTEIYVEFDKSITNDK